MRKPTPGPYIREVRLRRGEIDRFDHYPFALPTVQHLDVLRLHPKVTFLVGENGTGKSTLLEAIAVAWGFNAEGGSVNFNFSTRPTHSELSEYLTLVKTAAHTHDGYFLRAESFYNVATEIENLGVGSYYGKKPLHEQSHGESFFALFMERFRGYGLYILDEPEAALSPMRQMAMLTRLHELAQSGSQVIIATHSPMLMTYPDAIIYSLDDDGLHEVSYRETEHFFVTNEFLKNPDRMLRQLIGSTDNDDE